MNKLRLGKHTFTVRPGSAAYYCKRIFFDKHESKLAKFLENLTIVIMLVAIVWVFLFW